MELFNEFMSWAWARHHNMLSWYIRPLFLLPLVYFAYRRNIWGIIGTIVALATSMFWFPAPAVVDPQVEEFLAMERDYILGTWSFWKIMLTLTVPLSLWGLAAAFWYRSFTWGVLVINAMGLGKILWSYGFAETDAATQLLWPALLGLVICNLVVLWFWRRARSRRAVQPV